MLVGGRGAEIPGLFAQAKRLDQVADAAETLGHAHVEVVVEPQLSPADRDALDAANGLA
ncbi:MAG: hypothetical protein LBS56_04830 [Propionibacteriaceae bacterium]|jgi:hypothetical protein|nr:hypothetical protein [Propionibacteriaceae bacterium]